MGFLKLQEIFLEKYVEQYLKQLKTQFLWNTIVICDTIPGETPSKSYDEICGKNQESLKEFFEEFQGKI